MPTDDPDKGIGMSGEVTTAPKKRRKSAAKKKAGKKKAPKKRAGKKR